MGPLPASGHLYESHLFTSHGSPSPYLTPLDGAPPLTPSLTPTYSLHPQLFTSCSPIRRSSFPPPPVPLSSFPQLQQHVSDPEHGHRYTILDHPPVHYPQPAPPLLRPGINAGFGGAHLSGAVGGGTDYQGTYCSYTSHQLAPVHNQRYPKHPSAGMGNYPPQYQPYNGSMSTTGVVTKLSGQVQRRCFKCHTTDAPSWRRSKSSPGKIVCNKCGLYERVRLCSRPLKFCTPPSYSYPSRHSSRPSNQNPPPVHPTEPVPAGGVGVFEVLSSLRPASSVDGLGMVESRRQDRSHGRSTKWSQERERGLEWEWEKERERDGDERKMEKRRRRD